MNKKVLLTGATGFVGSYIARYLLIKGYHVFATKRASSRMDLVSDIQDNIIWTDCDLQDTIDLEAIIEQVDSVIHCAAVVSFQPKDADLMYEVNVTGTQDLVNLSLQHKISRFVHISSIAALGRHKNDKTIDEKVEWEDGPYNTQYGISKQMSEREVWRGQAEGMSVCILNPSLILGAGYWDTGTPALFQRVHNGNSFYTTGSTGAVDVRDVARLAVLAMTSDISGERYIVSSENISYRSILNKIAIKLHKKPPHRKLNKILRALLWRADALISTFSSKKRQATKETLAAASRQSRYVSDKSKKQFNYQYLPIDQTITDTAKALVDSKQNNQNSGVLAFPSSFL